MNGSARISKHRFIGQLHQCYRHGDLPAAEDCLRQWEAHARQAQDGFDLLRARSEAAGFYRRIRSEEAALAAARECLALAKQLNLLDSPSGATAYINAATTFSSFGHTEEALALFRQAAGFFESHGITAGYEYAALLNNEAGALYSLRRYDEAEPLWRQAVQIMQRLGGHGAEAAISLVMLAHLTYERDETAVPQVEALLDEAWEQLNAPDQPRDGNYAFSLEKCAPSFEYFQRPEAAQALREVVKEIYEGT